MDPKQLEKVNTLASARILVDYYKDKLKCKDIQDLENKVKLLLIAIEMVK